MTAVPVFPTLLLLALLLLGMVALFIAFLSHHTTRKATLIVGGVVATACLIGAVFFVGTFTANRVNVPPVGASDYPMSIQQAMEYDKSAMKSASASAHQSSPPPDHPASSETDNASLQAAAPMTREEELSRDVASKMVSMLRTTARVLGRALAEEEKILAAKKDGAESEQPAPLRAEKEPDLRPDWVDTPAQLVGDAYQMSITIGPYTTRAECDAAIPDKLREALGQYVDACLGDQASRNIRLPTDYLREQLVKAEWQEVRSYSVGPMTQLYVLLQFDRKVKDRVIEAYREAVVADRLKTVAGWAAIGLLLVSVLFAYLKIDLATRGIYRNRLRVAAGLVILGLVTVAVVAMA